MPFMKQFIANLEDTKGLFSKFHFHFMKVYSSSKAVKWNLNMMELFISFCWLFLNIFICWSIGIWMEIIQYIAFLTKHRFTKKRNLLNNPLHIAVVSPFFCIISLLALFYDKSYILIQKHYYYIEYYVVRNDRF